MIENIKVLDDQAQYWFVRSQSGLYYDHFMSDCFIAIGWDKFNNIPQFLSLEKKILIEQIKRIYPKESKPGYVYEQIKRFIFDLSIGDIVIVPSANSNRISFGKIVSDAYLEDFQIDEKDVLAHKLCPFGKRRKVEWIKTISKKELDPYMYKLLFSQGTISNANNYSQYIDRTLYSYFVKGDKTHLVLRVQKPRKVFTKELVPLLDGASEIIEMISRKIEGGSNDVEIKLNVQSPGPIEYIFKRAAALPVFSFLSDLNEIENAQLEERLDLELGESNAETKREVLARITKTKDSMGTLNVNLGETLSRKADI